MPICLMRSTRPLMGNEGPVVQLWGSTMPLAGTFDRQVGSSPMSIPKPIVFVVDDDIWVRESLETLIQDEGWQPETSATAQDFLDRPRAFTPSCLVLDISLPG